MSEIRQSEKGNIFSSGQCGPVAKKLILKMLFWPTSDPLLLAPRAVKQDKNRLILLDESNSNLSCSLLGQFLVLLQNSKMEYEEIKREYHILRHLQKGTPTPKSLK